MKVGIVEKVFNMSTTDTDDVSECALKGRTQGKGSACCNPTPQIEI
jgi:hypothetical protein